jgi:hypothetical protein
MFGMEPILTSVSLKSGGAEGAVYPAPEQREQREEPSGAGSSSSGCSASSSPSQHDGARCAVDHLYNSIFLFLYFLRTAPHTRVCGWVA